MTVTYCVSDGNGTFIAECISCIDVVQARERAQAIANKRGETVYLSERFLTSDNGEAIEPE